MMGRKEDEREEEKSPEYEQIRCMAWNVNGWKGDGGNRKIRRIKGEVIKYDVFILTETHVADDEEEREAFNKNFKEYQVYHVHAKEGGNGGRRLGVVIGVKKSRIEETEIEIERETSDEGGRWIVMTMKG